MDNAYFFMASVPAWAESSCTVPLSMSLGADIDILSSNL